MMNPFEVSEADKATCDKIVTETKAFMMTKTQNPGIVQIAISMLYIQSIMTTFKFMPDMAVDLHEETTKILQEHMNNAR